MILAQGELAQSVPTVIIKQGLPVWTTFVPVIALAFTIGSFWWIYARRGSLKATAPKTYASFMAHQIGVRLPIVFHNTGARSIAVTDLRLVIDDDSELEWENTRKTLKPTNDDVLDVAAPFAVAGREARLVFVEFQQQPPLRWIVEPGRRYRAKPEADIRPRGGTEAKWRALIEFDLWAPAADLNVYIARRNRP